MGWPIGWTDCDVSAMDRFQEWLKSHGMRSEWNKVRFASDCQDCPECGEEFCEDCQQHFYECECLGPTQDGVEYREFDGVLFGRKVSGRK